MVGTTTSYLVVKAKAFTKKVNIIEADSWASLKFGKNPALKQDRIFSQGYYHEGMKAFYFNPDGSLYKMSLKGEVKERTVKLIFKNPKHQIQTFSSQGTTIVISLG